MIIGLCGRKRSGKDVTAALLVKELGFRRLAFADKLKELAAKFLNVDPVYVMSDAFKSSGQMEGPGGDLLLGREVLQRLGVACRETFGADFWVEQVLDLIRDDTYPFGHPLDGDQCNSYVITDVRFWNELEAVRRAGGLIVRVNRADRRDSHAYTFGATDHGRCTFMSDIVGTRMLTRCDLPQRAHPSHFSSDTHESETTLPDSGDCYDLVIESGSAEETAAQVLAWVKERL